MHRISYVCVLFCITLLQANTCNRYASLCNKRFNEVCSINSHNGSSYISSPVQDQDRSITQQLEDGIRSTKLPIHLDYVYKLGYYHDMVAAYLEILREKRAALAATHNDKIDQMISTIESAQQEVAGLYQRIADLDRQIADKQNWYAALSIKDKTIQAVSYGASVSALESKKISTQAALKIANATLEATKTGLQKAPTTNPKLAALDIEINLIDSIRKHIIDIGGPDTFTRTLFACHGLYKSELYSDHLTDLLNNLPDKLKTFLEPIKNKIKEEIPTIITKLYGTRSDAGGMIPYTPCLIDPSAIPLLSVLIEIREFLDKNPNELFTLVLEDATRGNWPTYEKVFHKSGIMHYAYIQDRNAPWPTLGEMIAAGKQLVVFMYGDDPVLIQQYPWLNSFSYFCPWRNKWNYSTTQELLNSEAESTIRNPNYRDNTPPFNKLLDIPHQVTPGLAGDKKMAAIVNERSNMRKRMLEHMQVANHIINIVSVDFYEYPSTHGIPDVIDVCDEINGVGKYEGRPLWQPTNIS